MIEPAIDVHQENVAYFRGRDCAVHDPLSQGKESNIIVLGRNEFDHHIASTSIPETNRRQRPSAPAGPALGNLGGGCQIFDCRYTETMIAILWSNRYAVRPGS